MVHRPQSRGQADAASRPAQAIQPTDVDWVVGVSALRQHLSQTTATATWRAKIPIGFIPAINAESSVRPLGDLGLDLAGDNAFE